jgi:ribonuclease G
VYVPGSRVSGVSRRLEESERDRLRSICRSVKPDEGGLIIRTAAEGAGREAVERDLRFLHRVWAGVSTRAKDLSAPALVYRESELSIRALRDIAGAEFEKVVVDDEILLRRLRNYLRATAPGQEQKVTLHGGTKPAFEEYGLAREIRRALMRRVELPSGGYLVIDHTEAMTVIDVNTGRFVGSRFLEDTTLRTNLEACKEVVRQLRLRDIGGIIVIDFIDMAIATNREMVLAAFESELARDRTKTYVVEISPLGLVEMTRQNTTMGLFDLMTSSCPTCHGEGRVLSLESALISVERRLRDFAQAATTPGLRVEVHPEIAAVLVGGRSSMLERLQQATDHFFEIVAAGQAAELDYAAVIRD